MAADRDKPLPDVDPELVLEQPRHCGAFQFFLDGLRWEWSDELARMHGYEPGTVVPTTELIVRHKHPDDRQRVAALLDRVAQGELFSSRHRIIDKTGRIRWVVVVGNSMTDQAGSVIGTAGFYIDLTESIQSDITAAVTDVVGSRARIEQAKGVLMGAYGISADRAFEVLTWCSQRSNIKVREVAERLLANIAGTASADASRVDHALLNLETTTGPAALGDTG